jgi:hypothetical protein
MMLFRFLLPLALVLIPSLGWAANTWEEYTKVSAGYLISVHMATVLDGTDEADRQIVDVSADGCSNSFVLTYAKLCVGDDAATAVLEWDESTDDVFLRHQISDSSDDDCAVLDMRGHVSRGDIGIGISPLVTTAGADILLTTTNLSETNATVFVHVEGFCR